jgi:predicted DNA-binding transcriptional regulator AlpA
MPYPNIALPRLAEVLSDSPGWLDEAIDTAEAGRIIGFTPRTLDTWRSRGGGPPFLKLGRRAVRYQRRALFEWLAERQRCDTSDEGKSHG